uniref:AlNc14C35G3148 protein n=1 Tax=Albugo laibachii Nc14 TaxID=890382 RepID=F0W8M3_9STRA|nr:AlNc14C35G3148 [Albugo laibachii Nc14]|eukprot:CCA17479.1 AlNc14C35G3148 [Albugo laibachii Nc14]
MLMYFTYSDITLTNHCTTTNILMLRAILTPFSRTCARLNAVPVGTRLARHLSAARDDDASNGKGYNPFERLLESVQQKTNLMAIQSKDQDTHTQIEKYQVQDKNIWDPPHDQHSRETFPSQSSSPRVRRRRYHYKQVLIKHIVSSDRLDYVKGMRAQNGNLKRLYMQHIRRKADGDRVCRNCGELGHVSMNCLLPVICRACGDIGHSQHECHYAQRKQDRAIVEIALHSKILTNYGPSRFDQEIEEHLAIPKRNPRKKTEAV